MKVFLKKSPRTGNPEVWAYYEGRSCRLIFGSLLTGGLQTQDKPAGYGRETEKKKRCEYVEVPTSLVLGRFTEIDIAQAKILVRGATGGASSEPDGLSDRAHKIFRAAIHLCGWEQHPHLAAWVESSMRRPLPGETPPPQPKPARPRIDLGFQQTDAAYSW